MDGLARRLAVSGRQSIRKLIDEKRIETHFQPLISIKKHEIIGFEALSRGITSEGKLWSPIDCLKMWRKRDLLLNWIGFAGKKHLKVL